MQILLAQSSDAEALQSDRSLGRIGHSVRRVRDGIDALAELDRGTFDLVIVDWLLPRMDGIELTRRLRERPGFESPLLFLMEHGSERARAHAMEAGADDVLMKPFQPSELMRFVTNGFRREHRVEVETPPVPAANPSCGVSQPPCPAVCITASTGGPNAIAELVESVAVIDTAVFLVVLHGPDWMFEAYQSRLQRLTDLRVELGTAGAKLEPGRLFVAPGGRQMLVDPCDYSIRLEDDPPEHFMLPAADPLFRSAAVAFGPQCLGAVLTGLGRDGTIGARWIRDAGGRVLVQDPNECPARAMPASVIDEGVECDAISVRAMASAIDEWTRSKSATLDMRS